MFNSNAALWFSPNGNKLAFGYFDDSSTPIMTIPFYGYPGSLTFQYTSAIPIHYPKVSAYFIVFHSVFRGAADRRTSSSCTDVHLKVLKCQVVKLRNISCIHISRCFHYGILYKYHGRRYFISIVISLSSS